MDSKTYKIGEISKITNLTIDTLRYYEKEGLITPARDQNNIRMYSDSDIRWIQFIKKLKQTGMPLKNIKEYSNLRDQGDSTINERLSLLYEQKQRLEQNSKQLEEHILFLNNKIDIYKTKIKNQHYAKN
ncbi:MerR family transcriptional regulator [Bombilactobacillus mellis]|uniref:MerR family transcriptional regulator n=1 Tax=Bombilactobacillus mellis TaxID=1218508 RepID=UPI002248625A|nr:MerR family transcriptional regulator [Bombilactobacillus mellis]MCX0279872.1 MerR family transcriptional regulator [Bombilactobacillus mellis]